MTTDTTSKLDGWGVPSAVAEELGVQSPFIVPDLEDHSFRYLDERSGEWVFVSEPYGLHHEGLEKLARLREAGWDVTLFGYAEHNPGTLRIELRPPAGRMREFRMWLSLQKERRDPVGVLSLDVGYDPSFPAGDPQLSEMVDYLEKHSVSDGTLEALRRAHAEWQREEREAYGKEGHDEQQ